jgi:phosphoserine phosphatase
VKNDKILQPPEKDWRRTSPFLTADAASALAAACAGLAAPGQPLPTSKSAACADEILAVYTTAKTREGKAAFAGFDYRTMEPSYAWVAQLQAGFTHAEVKGFGQSALEAGLAAPLGATQTLGTTAGLNAYVRVYDPIKDLIDVMAKNGLDVWIVSASAQPIVEAFAEKVGVAADHVIGIRLRVDGASRLTYDLQGCGPVPDGAGNGSGQVTGNSLITYIEGKRCWINKVIYGVEGADAIKKNPDPAKRPVFGAGDSDTDIAFLHDATALKLVVNRNKKEIMCNAYDNHMDRWLINPMFIEPKGQFKDGYACSTSACKDASGASVACVNEAGEVIADQVDAVF